MLIFLFCLRCAGSNGYSDFPSTLHCYENSLLHAQSLLISIITWPFQSPQYHWLTALHVPRLPAICKRPFRGFRERGHNEFARDFRARWNNGLMASPIMSPYFWTKPLVDRLHHTGVLPQQFSLRLYPTPPLSLPETSLSFFSLGSSSARTRRLHHPFQT